MPHLEMIPSNEYYQYYCQVKTSLIRQLNADDLPSLIPLFDAYRQFYRQSSDPGGAEKFIEARIQNGQAKIYGYFIESQLAGFALLYPLFSSVRMKSFYLLNDLYVVPEFRNNHIGSSLLRYCQSVAKEENQAGIMLETERSNQVGNHLYPAMGFESITNSNFYFWESK